MKDNPANAPGKLLIGPIAPRLFTMSSSMLIGFIAGAAFNVTDTYFVSKLGTDALAAMGFTMPVVMVIFGIIMGVGIGVSSVLSRTIGRGDQQMVQRITFDTLLLGLIFVGIFIILGFLTMKPLFIKLGADENTLPLVMDYMRIWFIGIPFLIIPIIGNNAIRATGDTFSPSIIMLLDLGLNIILDPVLIFGWGPFPEMGIKGAALATVFCRSLALCASLYILYYRKKMLRFILPNRYELWESWKQILYIGIPAGISHLMVPVGMGIIIRIVASYGNDAVAAMTAGMRIDQCITIPMFALGGSLVPFVGQNWGARQYDRVFKAQRIVTGWLFIWSAFCVCILWTFRKQIAPIFTESPDVIQYLRYYLWIIPLAYGFRGLAQVSNASMNAINHPYHSTAHLIIRLFALTVPLAYLGSYLKNFPGLLVGLLCADIIAALTGAKWINWLYHKHSEPIPSENANQENPA